MAKGKKAAVSAARMKKMGRSNTYRSQKLNVPDASPFGTTGGGVSDIAIRPHAKAKRGKKTRPDINTRTGKGFGSL